MQFCSHFEIWCSTFIAFSTQFGSHLKIYYSLHYFYFSMTKCHTFQMSIKQSESRREDPRQRVWSLVINNSWSGSRQQALCSHIPSLSASNNPRVSLNSTILKQTASVCQNQAISILAIFYQIRFSAVGIMLAPQLRGHWLIQRNVLIGKFLIRS